MANKKNNVIKGEASESDSEDEHYVVDVANYRKKTLHPPQGTIVDGEAPESDDEIVSHAKFQIPTNNNNPRTSKYRHVEENRLHKSESLLIKKLSDSNLSLWNHLNLFVQNTALSASKQILATDQLLLKSQISLQTTSNSIKKINENSTQLLEKYKYLLTGNFIPNIQIE